MATWPEIQAGIFAGESGGDYDALFGYANRPGGPFAGHNVTGMTIDEAIAFSNPSGPYAQHVKGKVGRVATPMGAYQIVGDTLKQAKRWAGLTGNERMTRQVQDLLGQAILKNQGTGAWAGYRGPRAPGSVQMSGGDTPRISGPVEAAGGGFGSDKGAPQLYTEADYSAQPDYVDPGPTTSAEATGDALKDIGDQDLTYSRLAETLSGAVGKDKPGGIESGIELQASAPLQYKEADTSIAPTPVQAPTDLASLFTVGNIGQAQAINPATGQPYSRRQYG